MIPVTSSSHLTWHGHCFVYSPVSYYTVFQRKLLISTTVGIQLIDGENLRAYSSLLFTCWVANLLHQVQVIKVLCLSSAKKPTLFGYSETPVFLRWGPVQSCNICYSFYYWMVLLPRYDMVCHLQLCSRNKRGTRYWKKLVFTESMSLFILFGLYLVFGDSYLKDLDASVLLFCLMKCCKLVMPEKMKHGMDLSLLFNLYLVNFFLFFQTSGNHPKFGASVGENDPQCLGIHVAREEIHRVHLNTHNG